MKKIILVTLFLLGGALSVCISGRVQQTIPMQIIDEGAASSGNTLTLERPWYIYQDDYVLTLPVTYLAYTLELRQGNSVEYSIYVSSSTTQVILPDWLVGNYEIRLVPFTTTYYYRGYIYFE